MPMLGLGIASGSTNAGGRLTFTVPNGYDETGGPQGLALPYSHFSVSTPVRFQQVFDASQFQELSQGGGFIVALYDRGACGTKCGFFVTNIALRLSTSSSKSDQLSMRFDENVGLDQIVVCSEKRLHVLDSGAICPKFPGGQTFYPVTTPFFYNPTKGNLVLDLQFASESPDGGLSCGGRGREAVALPGDSVSSIAKVGTDLTTADTVTTGGIIFGFVVDPIPELLVSHQTNTIVLNWPYNTPAGFKLQSTDNLSTPSSWVDMVGKVISAGLKGNVLLLPDSELTRKRFFRLFWNSPQPGIPSPTARVVTPSELEPPQ